MRTHAHIHDSTYACAEIPGASASQHPFHGGGSRHVGPDAFLQVVRTFCGQVPHQDGTLGRNAHAVARLLVKTAAFIRTTDLQARNLAGGIDGLHQRRGRQARGQFRIGKPGLPPGRQRSPGRFRHQAKVVTAHVGLGIVVELLDQRIIAPHHPADEADGNENGKHADGHAPPVGQQIPPDQFGQRRHKASFSVRS